MLDEKSKEGWAIAHRPALQPVAFPSRPAPTPLFGTKPPAEPYPLEALGPLRDAADAIAAKVQAPPAIAAQAVLAATSLAVQGLADVATPAGPKPTSLFCLTVADSGERKSACNSLALSPVYKIQRVRLAAYKRQLAARETESPVVETTGDLPASPPLAPNILFGDPTVEGLMRHFQHGQPSIGVFSDEGGQLLGGAAMSSENKLKTSAAWSHMWDGSALDRARAGGEAPETFYGRRAALHLMIQPVVAKMIFSDTIMTGQGILARMLIVEPDSLIGHRLRLPDFGLNPIDPALTRYHAQIEALLQRPMPTYAGDAGQLELRTLAMSDEAIALFGAFYERVETAQASGHEFAEVRGFASKAGENACRLAGVLTLYEDPLAIVVPGEMMAHAIQLIGWYLHEARRLLTAAEVPEDIRDAERLRQWIADRWRGETLTIREAQRHGPSRLRMATKLRRLFGVLERHGYLAQDRRPEMVGRESWIVYRACDAN